MSFKTPYTRSHLVCFVLNELWLIRLFFNAQVFLRLFYMFLRDSFILGLRAKWAIFVLKRSPQLRGGLFIMSLGYCVVMSFLFNADFHIIFSAGLKLAFRSSMGGSRSARPAADFISPIGIVEAVEFAFLFLIHIIGGVVYSCGVVYMRLMGLRVNLLLCIV